MKTTLLLGIFAVALALGPSAFACDDKAKHEKKTSSKKTYTQAQAGDKGGQYLTGSYIKQDVRRTGRTTDGAYNVRVYDSKDIERSGQANVRDFLRQQGATR